MLSPSPIPPTPFGRYTLVSKLAAGGMAEIFLAVERTEHAGRRLLIIKKILPVFEDDPDYVEFFLTEGRVSLQCAHPNLPQVYELQRVGEVWYLAMEFIRGVTLLDLLRAGVAAGTQLSVSCVMTICHAVAAALEHVHGLRDVDGAPLRVIHRDVTPQNILITYDGAVKLIDFGVARAALQRHRTDTGIVKGKFAYLAPEQLQRGAGVDQRADIFALGIVMHEALMARPLFRARTDRDTVKRVLYADIPDVSAARPDVSPELTALIARALARDPDARFASATELLVELERVAERSGIPLSMLRVRRELTQLVGDAPQPITPEVEDTDVQQLAEDDDDDFHIEIDDGALGSRRAIGNGTPPAGQSALSRPSDPRGLARDPDLIYFLTKSGARIPKPRPRRLRTTHQDAEFAELLANLDR